MEIEILVGLRRIAISGTKIAIRLGRYSNLVLKTAVNKVKKPQGVKDKNTVSRLSSKTFSFKKSITRSIGCRNS